MSSPTRSPHALDLPSREDGGRVTTVLLLRHGEVYNPDGILYGRAPGFRLSQRGRAMAERVAERIGDRDITHVISSPLQRARETAGPLAARFGNRGAAETALARRLRDIGR